MHRPTSPARARAIVAAACAFVASVVAARDFEQPQSGDTSQQFSASSVQRQDTPDDPDYDRAEPDDEDGVQSSNLFDEQFYLFGFPSRLTQNTALYKDGPHAGQPMVSGFNAAGAWKATRGRADVTIAILDTGIKWDQTSLRVKVHLNCGELPAPRDAQGQTVSGSSPGCKDSDKRYDLNADGVFNVDDYADDPRVDKNAGPNGVPDTVDAQDLLRTFSDGADDDRNGFVDDLAGWDFFNDDNDPYDQSSYFAAENHGSGRTEEAVEQGNDGAGGIGVCPRCQFLPIRTWDTFVSDGNTFAMGIVYAAANGAQVIEGSNGSVTHTAFAEAASEYAYQQGAVQVFSGDDLNTGNHNFPAAYSHPLLIQGTVPDTIGLGQDAGSQAAALLAGLPVNVGTFLPVLTYFRGANTTQYGGKSSIAMEGATGSENTGKSSGAAGLVIGAALEQGVTLRPDETRAILEQTAEDVTQLNGLGAGLPDFAQAGWDPHFGYGRVNLGAAVALAQSGQIPPEAAIDAPDWYAPLTGDSVQIGGLARARFASGGRFHWELQWGAGLAPSSFVTVNSGDSTSTVTDFGSIDLKAVRAALAAMNVPPDTGGPVFSPTAPNPFQQQFAVRLVVTGEGLPTPGVDRRVLTTFSDAALRPGYPKRLGAGGEAPLRYADLDGDNTPELIVPLEDGWLHVYRKDGGELAGFPVHTQLQFQAAAHTNAPGFAELLAQHAPYEELRGVAVADLDDDGIPELITSAGIHVYVWEADGALRAGFPVALDLRHCAGADQQQEDANGRSVHRKCGFVGSPAVGRVEGADRPLDIVAAGLDGHLYAWRGDGSGVPGYPVNLVDPGVPADRQMLAESINNPAVGDLDGDGHDDIVIASNETYGAAPSGSDIAGGLSQAFADLLAEAAGGSSRLYAISGATGEFLPGWPLHLNGGIQDTLPLIGPGHDAALAKINGEQRVIVSTTGGALAEYSPSGSLSVGVQQQLYGAASDATDRLGAINLFEYASVGDVLGTGQLAIVKYGLSLAAVANLALAGQNVPYNHLIGAYDAQSGLPLPAYPAITDDYQFLSTSSIGKVVGGSSNQILAGTGLGLLHAYDGATGADVSGFPKVTGGWLFAPAELSQDGRLADITREGWLFEWDVAEAPACQTEWPTFRHDPHNSGNYDHDGRAPAALTDLAVSGDAHSAQLSWTAPGSDGLCAATKVDHYRVRLDGRPSALASPPPSDPGLTETMTLADLSAGAHTLTVQAVDAAGNVGYPVSVRLEPDTGSGGGSAPDRFGGALDGGFLLLGLSALRRWRRRPLAGRREAA